MSKMKNPKTKKILFFMLFLGLVAFFRFYNLDQTARLTRDEANDLFRMQSIYKEKKLTLIGPISNDNGKVFGSLTYYMYLPFAALGNFDAVSPVWGAAFWGVLSSVILLLISKKLTTNKTSFVLSALLLIIWFPLLRTSRWAWNPHLVIFWVSLGIYLHFYKTKFWQFLAGLCFGLSFHNHYLAFFATTPFILISAFLQTKKKNWPEAVSLLMGYGLVFLPFVLFDLRHPPGLFFGKYLLSGDTPHSTKLTLNIILSNTLRDGKVFLDAVIQNKFLQVLFLINVLVLSFQDWQKNKKYLIWIIPVLAVIIAGSIIDFYFIRYTLAAVPFLLVWLLLPRKKISLKIANLAIFILLFASLFSFYPQISQTEVQPSMRIVREIITYMKKVHRENEGQIRNPNIAVLQSSDHSPLGDKYRELFRVNKIDIRADSEYDASEHLFVFSQKDIAAVRQDKSTAMVYFKDAKLADSYAIPNSDWFIYWLRF